MFYSQNPLSEDDLTHIAGNINLRMLSNKKIFITGGTGFIGKWLLCFIEYGNRVHDLKCSATILSRNPGALLNSFPFLADSRGFSFLQSDIRDFAFKRSDIDYIIHAATDVSQALSGNFPIEALSTIVNGTKHLLEFSLYAKASRVLFLSSGAIYGKQSLETHLQTEDSTSAPDINQENCYYGEGKRMAEVLCRAFHAEHALPVTIARCFTFMGPLLNFNANFAISEFILRALKGEDIIISGNRLTQRSYMYTSDLIIWLLTILERGSVPTAYNVGSDQKITIFDLAQKVADISGKNIKIEFAAGQSDAQPSHYVPNIEKAKRELNLEVRVPLDESIRKTMAWARDNHLN